jgi:transcriptional regulator with PAS, ATPase and Fis domain
MKTTKTFSPDFFDRVWEESWTYIKTVVDVMRAPVLILNKDFKVLAMNEAFCNTFEVNSKEIEGKSIYKLGNGQWNIPALKKLLETILPKHTFFKGFQVAHEFPKIGRKIMILNARQINFKVNTSSELSSPIILVAIEDVTKMMAVADTLSTHANVLETKLSRLTETMEQYIKKLETEVLELKKRHRVI